MCGAFHEKRLSPWGALSGGSTGGIEGSWSAHGPSSGSFSSAIGLERPITVGGLWGGGRSSSWFHGGLWFPSVFFRLIPDGVLHLFCSAGGRPCVRQIVFDKMFDKMCSTKWDIILELSEGFDGWH